MNVFHPYVKFEGEKQYKSDVVDYERDCHVLIFSSSQNILHETLLQMIFYSELKGGKPTTIECTDAFQKKV